MGKVEASASMAKYQARFREKAQGLYVGCKCVKCGQAQVVIHLGESKDRNQLAVTANRELQAAGWAHLPVLGWVCGKCLQKFVKG